MKIMHKAATALALGTALLAAPAMADNADIAEAVEAALADTQLDACMTELEITENVVMQNIDSTISTLEHLKAMGVSVSMDDFGTGYSSLSYLRRLPVDTVKIDKSFVQSRELSERLIVLRSIIAMAKGLNQKIIAEGVEYESDVADLLQLGCENAQGYLFGEPMSIKDVEEMLADEIALAGE